MTKRHALALCDFSGLPRVDTGRLQELHRRSMRWVADMGSRGSVREFLDVQHTLGYKLARTSNLDDVLYLALEAATSLWSFDCGGIYLLDDEGVLRLRAHRNLPAGLLDVVEHFGDATGVYELALAGQICYLEPGSEEYAAYSGLFVPFGIKTVAVAPILEGGVVRGCFNLGSRTAEEVPESLRDAVEVLVYQVNDVIIRVLATQEREALLHKYAAFAEAVDDAVLIHRGDTVIAANRAFERMTGYTEAEARRLGVLALFDAGSRGCVSQRTLENDLSEYEADLRRKDGSDRRVRVRVKNVRYNGRPEPCRAKIFSPVDSA